jgi:hypothetical protein
MKLSFGEIMSWRMSSATGTLIVCQGLACTFDETIPNTNPVALSMIAIELIVFILSSTEELLPLLLVFPGFLQVNEIRPAYFLSHRYENLRSTVRNSSTRARL